MCGVAGYSGENEPSALVAALSALAHRGPDDSGIHTEPSLGLAIGHTRLSIIDLAPTGHQPMVSASGRFVIVFNGEIYNFRELRAPLEKMGMPFRGHSDTEVLLALYEARGAAMLPELNGIFAFAILDRADGSLLLATDRMAVKPLYFHSAAAKFSFASELKALTGLLGARPEIDAACLYRMLGFLWSPGGQTPLKGVQRLGPGEALIVKAGSIEKRWRWAPLPFAATLREWTDADATTAVESTLRTAVHRQLVADVPIGAFLSGGLDSSAIVALAREQCPGIECFTIDTGDQQDDGVIADLPYARKVARHLGVRLHEIKVGPNNLADSLSRMVAQLDEPLADPAALHVMSICGLAREHGYKVLLSGAGGDDLFTGYRRHLALQSEKYWSWLPSAARGVLRSTTAGLATQWTGARRAAKAFAFADASERDRLASYFLWANPACLGGLFAEGHRAEATSLPISQPLMDYLDKLPARLHPLEKMLALEQRFFLVDHNLLYTDKMSMAVGVEVRVPFLDNDLVALANSLPLSVKQRGTEGKWVLKKAMESLLPAEVIYRPKTGFGAPVRRWLRNELKDWVGDLLAAETLRRRGIFDPPQVARLVEDDRAGRIDAAYTILSLACIESWCQTFMDCKSPPDTPA
jgi:asparagine synthase (glutamine-hydrolysing)